MFVRREKGVEGSKMSTANTDLSTFEKRAEINDLLNSNRENFLPLHKQRRLNWFRSYTQSDKYMNRYTLIGVEHNKFYAEHHESKR